MGPENLDSQIMGLFGDLWDACKACEDADEAQWQEAVQTRKRLVALNPIPNPCAEVVIAQTYKKGRQQVGRMWDAYDALKAGYVRDVRPHAEVAVRLHREAVEVWDPVIAALDPIIADVQTRMQQTHWTGAAADRYMKQLPVQLAALQEFKQYALVGRAGVDTPAMLQQMANQAMQALVRATTIQVYAYANWPNDDDTYFARSISANTHIEEQGKVFVNKIVEGNDFWKPLLNKHVEQMTSSDVRNPKVLTGDRWPEATTATSATAASTSKYSLPPGVES